jgi:acyl-CoA reductase-like NAD-dependent aldehyde dehydrogenase
VLEDANPAAITNGLFWGAFTNSGQICAGIKRLFVPEKLHDAVVEALVARAVRVRIGDGTTPGMHFRPDQQSRAVEPRHFPRG